MVCLRYISINPLHEGDNKYKNNNSNRCSKIIPSSCIFINADIRDRFQIRPDLCYYIMLCHLLVKYVYGLHTFMG